jgi:hypothetical protein
LKIATTTILVRVAMEVCYGGGVIKQLVPANARQPYEICEVRFEYLIRILKGNQDIRV